MHPKMFAHTQLLDSRNMSRHADIDIPTDTQAQTHKITLYKRATGTCGQT